MLTRDAKPKSHSRMQLLRELIGGIVDANRDNGGSIRMGTMIAEDVRLKEKSAMQMLEDLVEDIVDLNLQKGISNHPDAKWQAAQRALNGLHASDHGVAVLALRELISAVETQRPDEGGIPEDDAQELISAAREIVKRLAAGSPGEG